MLNKYDDLQYLVRAGYVWWYQQYAKNGLDLKEAEEYARSKKVVLRKLSDAIAPLDYRRGR